MGLDRWVTLESKSPAAAAVYEPAEVRYRQERAFKAFVIFFYAVAYFAMLIVYPVVLFAAWQKASASYNPSDILVFLVGVSCYPIVLYFAVRGLREYRDITSFEFFRPDGFTYLGDLYNWKSVECVYMNPFLDYLTILFKGPGRKERPAGYCYNKFRFEPSFEELLALLKAEGVLVDHVRQISLKDLDKIKKVRSTSLELDWLPP